MQSDLVVILLAAAMITVHLRQRERGQWHSEFGYKQFYWHPVCSR